MNKKIESASSDQDQLHRRLLERQSGKCFICDEPIDLVLQKGQLDVDHIIPRVEEGPDEENNYALTHASCNRSKSGSDLRVARRMAEFENFKSKHGKKDNAVHIWDTYWNVMTELNLVFDYAAKTGRFNIHCRK